MDLAFFLAFAFALGLAFILGIALVAGIFFFFFIVDLPYICGISMSLFFLEAPDHAASRSGAEPNAK